MYSVRYYPQFHVTAVGLGTYYPQIRGTPVIGRYSITFFLPPMVRVIDGSDNRDSTLFPRTNSILCVKRTS
jgi:hypothetical protein